MQSWQTSSNETDNDPPIPTELRVEQLTDGRVAFTSSTTDDGKENTTDPDNLTDQQKARAVTLNYVDKSCIYLTLSVPVQNDTYPNPNFDTTNQYSNNASSGKEVGYGRNFLFSGGGGVTYQCTRLIVPPSAPPPPPPSPPPPSPSPPPPLPPPPSPPPLSPSTTTVPMKT